MGCYTYPAMKIENLEKEIQELKALVAEKDKQIEKLIDLGQEYYGKEMRARE